MEIRVKTLGRKVKNYMREIKKILLNKKKPSFYAQKGKALLDANQKDEAINVFDKGLSFYPNSVLIHKEYAIHAMDEKNWKNAIHHWDFLYKSKKKKAPAEVYIQLSKALKFDKQEKKSISVLKSGLAKFPGNVKVTLELADLYRKQKDWKKAAELLIRLFEEEENKKLPVKAYMNLSDSYLKLHEFDRAEYVLRLGVEKNPQHKKLLNSYAHIAIQKKNWESAIQRLEYLSNLYEQKIPFSTLVKISMLKQITGNSEQAKNIFNEVLNNYQEEIGQDEEGYRKIILYDNGKSRIEFYKNLKRTNKVVLTFDSLNMVWKNPSFGFKLLLKQGVDVIALRKKKKKTYHQDLSQEEFVNVVNVLAESYKDKIAYGFSLGAYSALYYASNLNCRILALAPRLSIHPVYGKEGSIPKHEFKHNISNNYNEQISPIIVYDPKDRLDNTYVQNELIQKFPNAYLVKVPYGGHGMAPHLLRMGILKEFILSVIDEEIPKYDRKLKSKSPNYCRLLGRTCLRHNKIVWADYLSKRSIRLLPTDKYGIKFRVDVLKTLNQYDEAIALAKKSVKLVPKSLDVRIILIDLYIITEDLITAEKELKLAIKEFRKTPKLSKRINMINEAREEVVNTPLSIFVT